MDKVRLLRWSTPVVIIVGGIAIFAATESPDVPGSRVATAPAPAPVPPAAANPVPTKVPRPGVILEGAPAKPAPVRRVAAAAPASPPAAPPREAFRAELQQRLDALAAAYVSGDPRAAERVMWPNHVVIRPDGEELDRVGLLEVWSEEWQVFQNRDLKFYVEQVEPAADGKMSATWTLVLTADLEGSADKHMMVNGRQAATFLFSGEAQQLDGPIRYVEFERTLNGFAWPTE